jgi:hypothetical protein
MPGAIRGDRFASGEQGSADSIAASENDHENARPAKEGLRTGLSNVKSDHPCRGGVAFGPVKNWAGSGDLAGKSARGIPPLAKPDGGKADAM